MLWNVTGVFVSDPWIVEPIERVVEGESAGWATSVVSCEALKQNKLFLSARAVPVESPGSAPCCD